MLDSSPPCKPNLPIKLPVRKRKRADGQTDIGEGLEKKKDIGRSQHKFRE